MHPILFQIGSFTLRTYGVAMAVSFLLGLMLALRLNRRAGRDDEILMDLILWIMLGAIVGARILYIIVEWPQFWGPQAPLSLVGRLWNFLAVWRGGLVFYGGFAGAFVAALIFLKRHKLPLWSYADVIAPGLALGQVTGRIGCFFNGCCYGIPNREFGVVFPVLGDDIPRLPTQLYEATFCLLLAVFLTRFWARKSFDGQVFWLYVLLYAVWRFGIEFLRGDSARGVLICDALSPSQWLSLVAAAAALGMLFALRARARAQAAPAP